MRSVIVPVEVLRLASSQAGLVASRQCDALGLRRDARTRLVAAGSWLRTTTGVYQVDPAPPPASPDELRRRAAWSALLAFGPQAIAVGTSALALHGVHGLPVRIRPEASLPGGSPRHARDGLRLRCFEPVATVQMQGRTVASLRDALIRALPELPRRNGLAVMDDVRHRRLISPEEAEQVAASMAGRRGVRRVRTWWPFIDARAESPFESFARLECIDDGIPPDELQLEIQDRHGVLRGDMAWRLRGGRWLVVELDGKEFHDVPDAVLADRVRQNRIASTGRADLLRFAYPDLGTGRIPANIRTALGR
jgi:nucleotide-binding universal stress UspA family protein